MNLYVFKRNISNHNQQFFIEFSSISFVFNTHISIFVFASVFKSNKLRPRNKWLMFWNYPKIKTYVYVYSAGLNFEYTRVYITIFFILFFQIDW